jgi:hypothetical protein
MRVYAHFKQEQVRVAAVATAPLLTNSNSNDTGSGGNNLILEYASFVLYVSFSLISHISFSKTTPNYSKESAERMMQDSKRYCTPLLLVQLLLVDPILEPLLGPPLNHVLSQYYHCHLVKCQTIPLRLEVDPFQPFC